MKAPFLSGKGAFRFRTFGLSKRHGRVLQERPFRRSRSAGRFVGGWREAGWEGEARVPRMELKAVSTGQENIGASRKSKGDRATGEGALSPVPLEGAS